MTSYLFSIPSDASAWPLGGATAATMDDIRDNFGKIYDAYVDKIYRYVFLRVSSQEIAQDLTSETFTKCWESYQANPAAIKNSQAFLYRIAKNLVVDHYRVKGKSQVVCDSAELQIADPKSNLEHNAAIASDMEMVRKALAGLNDDYQNVIIWRYLDDLPMEQVAQLLDRSPEATRVLLHRAMKELKTKLS